MSLKIEIKAESFVTKLTDIRLFSLMKNQKFPNLQYGQVNVVLALSYQEIASHSLQPGTYTINIGKIRDSG